MTFAVVFLGLVCCGLFSMVVLYRDEAKSLQSVCRDYWAHKAENHRQLVLRDESIARLHDEREELESRIDDLLAEQALVRQWMGERPTVLDKKGDA